MIKFGKRRMNPFYTNYIVVGKIRSFSNKKNILQVYTRPNRVCTSLSVFTELFRLNRKIMLRPLAFLYYLATLTGTELLIFYSEDNLRKFLMFVRRVLPLDGAMAFYLCVRLAGRSLWRNIQTYTTYV